MSGGIRKRIGRNGDITWLVTVETGTSQNGKRHRIIKSVKGTKKEAEKLFILMMNELKDGTLDKKSMETLGQYLDHWVKTYVEPNLSPTTIVGYQVNIERHIKPYIGHIRLKELKPQHISSLYEKLLAEGRTDGKGGLSAKSIRYVHRNLKQALQNAVNLKIISYNPAASVTLPRVKKFRSEVYDENELIKLLTAVQGTDMEVPVTIDVVLGIRRGELLALKWSDVDLEGKKIQIKNNLISTTSTGIVIRDTKTESSRRTITIPEFIVNFLKKHFQEQQKIRDALGGSYNEQNLICCNINGKPYCPKYFSNKFRKFLAKKGLKRIRLHDLRHSNATLMLLYGVPAKIAAQRLGHSSVSVTLDIYSHVLQDMQNEVSDQIENNILKQIPDLNSDKKE